MSFDPYPTALDPEIYRIAAQAVVGHMPDKNHAIHAVIEVVRYGAGLTFPDPAPAPVQPPLVRAAVAPLTKDQVAAHLETLASHPHRADRKAVVAMNLPWQSILAVLAQALQVWLASQSGA